MISLTRRENDQAHIVSNADGANSLGVKCEHQVVGLTSHHCHNLQKLHVLLRSTSETCLQLSRDFHHARSLDMMEHGENIDLGF